MQRPKSMTLPIFGSVRLPKWHSNLDASILVAIKSKGFHCANRVRESTIVLRKLTDINEGDAICRVCFFIFLNGRVSNNESKIFIPKDNFYLFYFRLLIVIL